MADKEATMNREEIKDLAYSLERIGSKISRPNRVWFKGEGLYFDITFDLEDNGDIKWFEFTWGGKALSWQKDYPTIKIGNTNEFDTHDRRYPAVKIIETDSLSNPQFIEFVKAVLGARSDEPLFSKALELLN